MPPIKPRTMPGTMELLPADQIAFQRMLDTIRRAYERFAFLPIETPVMEFVDLLLTKSGGETEKQVYYAQSSGGRAKGEDPKLALRFDLTVPLARYVAEHEAKLVFPFRRYQMQRVYRGESAQKGRFREFYQCDADVVGKDRLSIEYDAEVVALVAAVFGDLQVGDFEIRVNNRKVLAGFLASLGVVDPAERAAVLREVDKLDKVGVDRVAAALGRGGAAGPGPGPAPASGTRPGTGDPDGDLSTRTHAHPPQGAEAALPRLSASAVDRLLRFVEIAGPGGKVVSQLSALGVDDDTFRVGVEELAAVAAALPRYGVPDACWGIHVAIARGLDYYTGTVCETFLRAHPEIGSVCSGGRYDDLAGYYTKSRLPGVGVSIGATRLFDQLHSRGLLAPPAAGSTAGVDVVVLRFEPALSAECLAIGTELRAAGIATEVLLEDWAPKKQLAWASQRGARFAIILGEDEHARGMVACKDLVAKAQQDIPRVRIAMEVATRVQRRIIPGGPG